MMMLIVSLFGKGARKRGMLIIIGSGIMWVFLHVYLVNIVYMECYHCKKTYSVEYYFTSSSATAIIFLIACAPGFALALGWLYIP